MLSLKNDLFVLQLVKTYLASILQNIDMLYIEKQCPRNLEIAVGTILGCRGKIDVEEIEPVRDYCPAYL